MAKTGGGLRATRPANSISDGIKVNANSISYDDFAKYNIQTVDGKKQTEDYAKMFSDFFDGSKPRNTTTNSFYFQFEKDGKRYAVRVSDHLAKFTERNEIGNLYDYAFDLSGNAVQDYFDIYNKINPNSPIDLYKKGSTIKLRDFDNIGKILENNKSEGYILVKWDKSFPYDEKGKPLIRKHINDMPATMKPQLINDKNFKKFYNYLKKRK
jgi:hypothetical protein